MKNTQTSNTPTIRIIDGIPFVRVIDLGHLWNTTTASILATDKPHQVPEEHLRRIDGHVWCSFPGLRYRVQAAKQGSQLTSLIREFLESPHHLGSSRRSRRLRPRYHQVALFPRR